MESKKANYIFAGAQFWNAVHNVSADVDGYNVYIDRPKYFNRTVAAAGKAFRARLPPEVQLAPLETRTSYTYRIVPGAKKPPKPSLPADLTKNETPIKPKPVSPLAPLQPKIQLPSLKSVTGRKLMHMMDSLKVSQHNERSSRSLLIQVYNLVVALLLSIAIDFCH